MNLVQIGANCGEDHVTKLIKESAIRFDKIILVEPIIYIIEALKKSYKNIDNVIIENCIISNSSETLEKIYYHRGSNYETSTLNKTHLFDHGCTEDIIDFIEVKNMTLTDLLFKHNIINLDYLFIDAEGQDVDILMNLDLSLTPVRHIHLETVHSDGAFKRGPRFKAICDYLTSRGYDYTMDGNDLTATRRAD